MTNPTKIDPYIPLKRMLLVSMIVIPFLPFLLVLASSGYFFYSSIESKTIENMKRIVDDHRQMIEFFSGRTKNRSCLGAEHLSAGETE
jgi:two-component system, NtrC family, sensor kinase